ncbi:MAG: glycosyltransferase family 2 protein [Bryobacteraceae bacterium]
MPKSLVTVVIPTLSADARLAECLASLKLQIRQDFEVLVVDNSGAGRAARTLHAAGFDGFAKVLDNRRNVGFGAAINQAMAASASPYLATLNDDAAAHPEWLNEMLRALERRPDAGMCAPQIRLFGEDRIDSAGMLVARDGSSKQRGQGRPPDAFPVAEEILFPSGCAALYRRTMLQQLGGFDEAFFLYCEDTDLGLRARWAGWKCVYAPRAVVEHHYSYSAGAASALKAYYVERNRLFVAVKNFPGWMLAAVPLAAAARYFWHIRFLLGGRGSAARFRTSGQAGPKLLWCVLRAHLAVVRRGGRLWRQRREIRARARITPAVFRHLLRVHSIGLRRIAAL